MARLVDGIGQSEMRIGLRTASFGSVEVHTVIHDSQVGVAVGSEKGDLRTFLSAEVSGLQTSFRQQELQFDSIRFVVGGANLSAGFSGEANSRSGSGEQQPQAAGVQAGLRFSPPDSAIDLSTNSPGESRAELTFNRWAGLSVHA